MNKDIWSNTALRKNSKRWPDNRLIGGKIVKKRALSLILVLCLVLTLVPVTADATDAGMMQIGTEMKKSWSAQLDECLFPVEITEAGFYDLTITDYEHTGTLWVDFNSDEHTQSYDDYYVSYDFGNDSDHDQITYKNLYFDKGVVELSCSYFDENYDYADAAVGLTLSRNETYAPAELRSEASYISVNPNEITWLSFRTTDAGDYILKSSEKTYSFAYIINKKNLDEEEIIGYFGKNKGYRLNLKSNTEYIIMLIPDSVDSRVTKVSMNKADVDIINMSIVSGPTIIPDSDLYDVQELLTYKIKYSNNTSQTLSYDDINQGSEFFNFDIEYDGEYNYTKPDEALFASGKQKVKLIYLNKESSSSITVVPFSSFVDDLNAIDEYDEMSIEYEDDYDKTYYWHIRPTQTGFYALSSYEDFAEVFDYYELAIFDESDNYVEWSGKEFFLKAGHDYCLRFNYAFTSDYYSAISFWIRKTETAYTPDAPTIKITTSNGKPKIYWDAVDGATKYWIYRSTDGKNFKYYDSTTKTSYTNSSTNAGTTYYYKVKAVNASADENLSSGYSNVKSIQCKPAAPKVVINRVSGKPKISWNAVSGATKYWIYRSTDGKNFKYYDSTTKTNYTNNSTSVGTKYYYRVKAVTVVNGKNVASENSNTKSLLVSTAAPSAKITTSNGKPKISWNEVSGATKYWIYRSTDGVNFSYWDSTTRTSYTNTGAKKNTKYYYRVKAVKVVNGKNIASAYSGTVSIKATK